KIANIFLTIPDDEMYGEVLTVFLEATERKHGVFGYIDESGGFVVPSMTQHIWDECQVEEKTFTFPQDTWGDSTWPQAIREKRTIYSNDPSTNIPEGHISIRRHISLPIIYRGEVIGLSQVANKETDYDEKDIKLYEAIAEKIAPILHARLQRDREEIERKRAEEEVRKHTVELAAVNQELEAFNYSVSHDLRAPLRGIDGFSQVLLEDYSDKLDAQGKDALQRVRAASQRMGLMVDDLLSLSRVTRSEMRSETVDLSELAKTIAARLQQTQPERPVEFVIEEGVTSKGDGRLLRVVLENLLGNAWKFAGKKPLTRIEFGLTEHDGKPAYFVRDNGAGFDMAYADKLFGAFQRLHAIDEFEGTGVGLATAQRIIHRHGGRIWAEGAVEQGATFKFTLEVRTGEGL
ncbi:MAG: ATP-binding protein, partial [Acidobacteriota bacterium]